MIMTTQFEARVICKLIGAYGEHQINRLLTVTLRFICSMARKYHAKTQDDASKHLQSVVLELTI